MILDDPIGEAIGEGSNGEARVGADRARHHRSVGHIEPRVIEDAAARIDDALSFVSAHRATADRVDRDDAFDVPERILHPLAAERRGHRSHRRAYAVYVSL